MVGCSSGTIYKMFSVDYIVIVHTIYFNFIARVHCDIFFSLGPEVKAIILNMDCSFGLSLSSRFFLVISVSKLSQFESDFQSINQSTVLS